MVLQRVPSIGNLLGIFFVAFKRDSDPSQFAIDFDKRSVFGLDLHHEARLGVEDFAVDDPAVFEFDDIGQALPWSDG
jgi:hypothetical protein